MKLTTQDVLVIRFSGLDSSLAQKLEDNLDFIESELNVEDLIDVLKQLNLNKFSADIAYNQGFRDGIENGFKMGYQNGSEDGYIQGQADMEG